MNGRYAAVAAARRAHAAPRGLHRPQRAGAGRRDRPGEDPDARRLLAARGAHRSTGRSTTPAAREKWLGEEGRARWSPRPAGRPAHGASRSSRRRSRRRSTTSWRPVGRASPDVFQPLRVARRRADGVAGDLRDAGGPRARRGPRPHRRGAEDMTVKAGDGPGRLNRSSSDADTKDAPSRPLPKRPSSMTPPAAAALKPVSAAAPPPRPRAPRPRARSGATTRATAVA